ncbi:MAG: CAP domain-containing protein [Planctomycetota bacterium]|nr:CAP domain-containing protein [Planctomycetota bacterium]
MPMRRVRFLALALSVSLWSSAVDAVAAAPAPKPLSAMDRQRVRVLAGKFRRAEDDAARMGVADELLAFGPAGAAALFDAADRTIDPLVRRYRADLLAATREVLRRRFEADGQEKLEALQDTLRSLGADGGLTKEKIKAEGDPALEKLQQRLVILPEEVLQAGTDLQAQRDRLLALGVHRQRAADYLRQHAPEAKDALPDPRPFEEVLRDHEALSGLLAVARTDDHRHILIDNAETAREVQPEEARGIRRMNRIRILAGLKPLRIDVRLCDAARDHSTDMVEKKFFAHDSPVPGKKTLWARAKRFGTTAHAENIAAGTATGAGAIRQWFHSPGHHKNMMGGHRRVGLGRHKKTWTLLFG